MRITRFAAVAACAGLLAFAAGAGLRGTVPLQPSTPADLLGQSREVLLDRLGPPSAITSAVAGQAFTYSAVDGTQVRVWVYEGIVIHVTPLDAGLPDPSPVPVTGAYLGQPLEEALRRLGPPASCSLQAGGPAIEVEWSDGSVVFFAHGIVAGVR